MWGKSNPKPSQNTTVISFDCVCPSLGSIQLFHGGIENLLNRYATKVFVDRVFGCVTIVSIYFNKLPGGLFCCLETTCVTRETQVARQNKFGTIQRSFQYTLGLKSRDSLDSSNCKHAFSRENYFARVLLQLTPRSIWIQHYLNIKISHGQTP